MKRNNFTMEDIIPFMSEYVRMYTSNESTSISYDKAKQIMGSIIYCLQELENENLLGRQGELIDRNKSLSVKKAFEFGISRKIEKINKAKLVFLQIKNDFYSYQNKCYYDTLIEGIPVFFERYDVKFDATNHLLTLDYPLLFDDRKLCGIDLIYNYLQNNLIEQNFLKKFSNEMIEQLLFSYDEGYDELIFNITKVVLQNALGCWLVGKKPFDLLLSTDEIDHLKGIFKNTKGNENEIILNNALHQMVEKAFENDIILTEYLKHEMKEFAFEITYHVENNCLDQVFIGLKNAKVDLLVRYEEGMVMDDANLRDLINEMSEMRHLSDKIIVIREQVKCLSDLKEILKECFFETEFMDVFQLLSEVERDILIDEIMQKKEFDEELEEWEIALLQWKL